MDIILLGLGSIRSVAKEFTVVLLRDWQWQEEQSSPQLILAQIAGTAFDSRRAAVC